MKLTKRQLKQIIKEEFEATISEMAFSAAEFSGVSADVESEAALVKYLNELKLLAKAITGLGGPLVFDPQSPMEPGISLGFNKDLTKIWRVLTLNLQNINKKNPDLNLKMPEVKKVDPGRGGRPCTWRDMERPQNADWCKRRLGNLFAQAVTAIRKMGQLAIDNEGVNIPDMDEPFLSVENGNALIKLATKMEEQLQAERT